MYTHKSYNENSSDHSQLRIGGLARIAKLRTQSGISLVELLIALVLSGLVATFVFNAYINQHKVVTIQEQVSEMQQNSRAAIDELTRQIRMAGYALPLGLPAIISANTNPDTIMVNYSAANCSGTLTNPMPQPSSELKLLGGQDLTCFYDGMWAYIFEPDSGGGEWFEITHVQQAAGHLQHNKTPLSKKYQPGAIVLSLDQIKFYIDESDTTMPKLMMQVNGGNPEVYAEYIEDLQFIYMLKNGLEVDSVVQYEDVRGVRISLTGRTADPDPDFPSDPFRRRTYSSTVHPRNLGS